MNYRHEIDNKFFPANYQKKFENITAKVSSINLIIDQPCIVHGDLYSRHLLFSKNNKLNGIIDWGDVSQSHYVIDLMVVYQFLPAEARKIFFKIYGEQPQAILDYAQFLGLYSATALLYYGTDVGDKSLIKSAIKTLEFL